MAAARHARELRERNLSQLATLQALAEELSTKAEGPLALADDMTTEDLRLAVEQLRAEHARLEQEVHRRPAGELLSEQAQGREAEGGGAASSPSDLRSKIEATATRRAKRRKVDDALLAYRLAGQTMFPLKGNRVGIRLDTAFQGKYYEQYYLVFNQSGEDGVLSLFKHTLPAFVPVRVLEGRLDQGLRRFTNDASDYLNAFVGRREQVLSLYAKQEAVFVDEPTCTAACDLVQLRVVASSLNKSGPTGADGDDDAGDADGHILVELEFTDLLATTPTACTVRRIDHTDTAGRRLRDVEAVFLDADLSMARAFRKAFL